MEQTLITEKDSKCTIVTVFSPVWHQEGKEQRHGRQRTKRGMRKQVELGGVCGGDWAAGANVL